MALVMAVGIMTVLGISSVTVIEYTTANSRTASYGEADQAAYALAEAGLNNAYSVLSKPGTNALDATLLGSRTTTYSRGSVTWSGTLDQATGVWTVTSTGAVRNPTGAPSVNRNRPLVAKIPINTILIRNLVNPVWNWMFATNTGAADGCDQSLASGTNIRSPLYIYGGLCMNNGAVITDTTNKLVIKQNLKMANTGNYIGQSSAELDEVHIGGTCSLGAVSHTPCRTGASPGGDQIWANPLDTIIPSISPPTVQWDPYYNNANPGPKYPCYAPKSSTPSSGWPVFDNNTVRDTSVTTSFELTPASSSYDCWTAGGQIAWNHVAKVLTVNGTIFIDGHVKASTALGTYKGRGTLYVSGSVVLGANARLCAKLNAGNTDCDYSTGGWDPNAGPPNDHFLTIVSNGSGGQAGVASGESIVLASSAHFQGGLYGTNTVKFAGSVVDQGPVVAGKIAFTGGVQTYPFSLQQVPSGVPGQPLEYTEAQPPQYSNG